MSIRGNPCSICAHPERPGIDLAMARGVAMAALAKRYGVSPDALWRHRKKHLTAAVRARLLAGPRTEIDLEHLREVEGQSFLQNIVAIRQRLFAALDAAEEAGDVNQITRVTSQLHTNLDISGRVLGELNVGGNNVTNNILISPAYLQLRIALVAALEPFPDAREAAAKVLGQLEEEAAKLIAADASRTLTR